MRDIETTLDDCVRPLRRDPEVALDVRNELAGHLEEHLAEGMSEEEALRRFGDPEEIGAGLLRANFNRLKLRAKIRFAVAVLAVPATIAALFFSINFRFWTAMETIEEDFNFKLEPPVISPLFRKIRPLMAAIGRNTRKLSAEETLIAGGDRSRRATPVLSAETNAQYALIELDPDSRIFRANAVLQLFAQPRVDVWKDSQQKFLIAEIEEARKFEPENGFYDFLLGGVLLDEALEFPPLYNQSQASSFRIRNRALLDRAMAIFRLGLEKPYVQSYIREMAAKRDALLKDETEDFASGVERIGRHSQILVPNLMLYRELGMALPFYGELLLEEGNQADGEFFLNAWKPFLHRIVEDEFCLVGLLVAGRIIDSQSRYARTPIPEERQQELAQAGAPIEKFRSKLQTFREKDDRKREVLKQAGLLSSLLLAGLPSQIVIYANEEMLEPERKLNYIFANGLMLQIWNVFGCIMLCGYATGMLLSLLRGRTGFLLTFSRRDAFRIGLWGVLVPVGLFFLLMECTPLGGRSTGMNIFNSSAPMRLALEAFAFVFLLPVPFLILWRRACRKRGRELGISKLSPAMWHCNMFIGWVVLLIGFTALIRPGLYFAERCWSARDKSIIHAEFFTGIEDQLTRDTREELLKALPE